MDHAQKEALPLVEWTLTPMGHCKPKEEYARVIASTNHLEILRLRNRATFSTVTEADKKLFWFPVWGKTLNVYLRALTGQSRDNSCPPIKGEIAESVMTWALNEVESTLGT